jgi:hypothetical protein
MFSRKNHFILALIFLSTFTPLAHAWVPNTKIDVTLAEECRPEFLEDGLLAKKGDMAGIQQFANDFFQRCEFPLKRRSNSTWLTMLSMHALDYNFEERMGIRKVEFVDHRDEVVRSGYLALQPGNRPRPLVVFQCGVLCNLKDSSMKSILPVPRAATIKNKMEFWLSVEWMKDDSSCASP